MCWEDGLEEGGRVLRAGREERDSLGKKAHQGLAHPSPKSPGRSRAIRVISYLFASRGEELRW